MTDGEQERFLSDLQRINIRLSDLEDGMRRDREHDLERRLAGLEAAAVDAIGSARKCVIDALQRHEDRLDKLEERANTGQPS